MSDDTPSSAIDAALAAPDRDPSGRVAARPSRRSAIAAIAVGAALLPGAGKALAQGPVDAIAFDGFPIFDPRSVVQKVAALVPERGRDLAQAWSAKLFGNSWLYAAVGQYATFDEVADNALRYAADAMGLVLSAADRRTLVAAYSGLEAWPDVRPALQTLRGAGIRLAFLSNLGEATLRANMARNGLDTLFDHVLSTDRVRAFKPSPKAYAMALEAFGLPKSRIGFAAFGGWDAAGAAWFGYRTAWVNRLGVPLERLGPGPAIVGSDMTAVLRLAALA
jgi:2-haloacid dehalogenase